MPISRFIFFSSKLRPRLAHVFQRLGPSKRIQSRSYVKSSKNSHCRGKPNDHPVLHVESQSSGSWGNYVMPAVLAGFAGIAAFLHYNDERRAVLKEFDQRIMGLTGPVRAIRQMAQEYRVYFRKVDEEGDDYLVESSHNMYLMNPKMEVLRCFGVEYTSEELSKEMLKELKKTPI